MSDIPGPPETPGMDTQWHTPPKTNMKMENQPFENVSPLKHVIKNASFSVASHVLVFGGMKP